MKKFSVLLVAILALMMLFVSCENEPKKRAATKEDVEIVMGLISSVSGAPVEKETFDVSADKGIITLTFEKAVYNDDKGNVIAVLNGTITVKDDDNTLSISVDFGDGTKYKGEDHTLLVNLVVKMPEEGYPDVGSYEIMLDGIILTDFDFDPLFKIMFEKS